MTKWLLDTNVISELGRPKPAKPVMDWLHSVDFQSLHTSAMNIAELRLGIALQASGHISAKLERWLETAVRPLFEGRIQAVTEETLVRWRALARDLEKKRKPAPAVDLLIAAIALENGLNVVTRDVKPFLATSVLVFNPWTGERFNYV